MKSLTISGIRKTGKLKPGQLFTVNKTVYRVIKGSIKKVSVCCVCHTISNILLCRYCKRNLSDDCYPRLVKQCTNQDN